MLLIGISGLGTVLKHSILGDEVSRLNSYTSESISIRSLQACHVRCKPQEGILNGLSTWCRCIGFCIVLVRPNYDHPKRLQNEGTQKMILRTYPIPLRERARANNRVEVPLVRSLRCTSCWENILLKSTWRALIGEYGVYWRLCYDWYWRTLSSRRELPKRA